MTTHAPKSDPDRRRFLQTALPTGALCCLGCSPLSALTLPEGAPQEAQQPGIQAPSGMTFEDVFDFSYRQGFIPLAKQMAEEMGSDDLIDLLKKAASDAMAIQARNSSLQIPNNDLNTFAEQMRRPDPLYRNALVYEIVEDTEKAFEVRITECLWAKTFRKSGASDIGYACICHPDFAYAETFNPHMRMIRTRTLMQGHDSCNHRWVMEE